MDRLVSEQEVRVDWFDKEVDFLCDLYVRIFNGSATQEEAVLYHALREILKDKFVKGV